MSAVAVPAEGHPCNTDTSGQDRRTVLAGSLALASVVAASAVPAAAEPQPDAELLGLGAQMMEAEGRRRQFDKEANVAFDRLRPVTLPDALFWQAGDERLCTRRDRLAQYYRDGQWCLVHEDGTANLVSAARHYAEVGEAYDWRFHLHEGDRARIGDIKAAYEAHAVTRKQAEDEAGITAAMTAGDRESELIEQLQFRIASTPAATLEGLCVKARAASLSLSDNEAWAGDTYLSELLAGWQASNRNGKDLDALTISMVVDLLRIGAGPVVQAVAT